MEPHTCHNVPTYSMRRLLSRKFHGCSFVCCYGHLCHHSRPRAVCGRIPQALQYLRSKLLSMSNVCKCLQLHDSHVGRAKGHAATPNFSPFVIIIRIVIVITIIITLTKWFGQVGFFKGWGGVLFNFFSRRFGRRVAFGCLR